jgi:uncharacterized repeat protein (TIGR03803 family)
MKIRLHVGEGRVHLNCPFRLVSLIIFGLAFVQIAQAQTSPVEVLYSFISWVSSKQPINLIKAKDGRFYGTTIGDNKTDLGSIFSLSHDGTFTTLYFFSLDGVTGDFPYGQLVEGTDGNIYGTTIYGGVTYQGVAFRITPDGALTVLHNFGSDLSDGTYPWGGLVQGQDGNFYGTTHDGGANGAGTVFRMTPEGGVTILHNFELNQIPTEGARPNGQTLTWGRDGLLYGVTFLNPDSVDDYGTVFRISTDGEFEVLYRFQPTSGYGPVAYLIQARDSNFYGTTQLGGTGDRPAGTVFQMAPDGTVSFLHEFHLPPRESFRISPGGDDPGIYPTNALVEAEDGVFYSTISGCTEGQDCIYRITRSGEFSDVYDFTSQEAMSAGRLILGDDGLYYSFAQGGGMLQHISDGDLFRVRLTPTPTPTPTPRPNPTPRARPTPRPRPALPG